MLATNNPNFVRAVKIEANVLASNIRSTEKKDKTHENKARECTTSDFKCKIPHIFCEDQFIKDMEF